MENTGTKKFDRLPPEMRKKEIKTAAMSLFAEKGFSATTMENIVERVSLSKGGVYRIYPSTTAIMQDLILDGMHLRNAFYAQKVREAYAEGQSLTLNLLLDLICDSLLIYPEISAIYVEFLWEKRRNPQLEELYRKICDASIRETLSLIREYGAEDLLLSEPDSLELITDLMNTAILGLTVLDLRESFQKNKSLIAAALAEISAKYRKA